MKNLNFLFLVGLLFMITSCTTTLYIPNASHVPLLQEENELKITASTFNNLQVAYAATDHIGLMANGFWTTSTPENKEESGDWKGSGSLVELGVGYFGQINRLVFETYLGGGVGSLEYKDSETNPKKSYSSKGTKFFIQPNLGWTSKFIDIGISGRMTGLKYNDFQANGYTPLELEQEFLVKSNVEDKMWVFFEPALTVRGGYKFLKAQLQYGISNKLTKGDLKYADSNLSVGLVFDLGSWYNR